MGRMSEALRLIEGITRGHIDRFTVGALINMLGEAGVQKMGH